MKVPLELSGWQKLRVAGAFRTSGLTTRDRFIRIWNMIISAETGFGTHFVVTKPDGILFAVLGVTNEILPIPQKGRDADRIFSYVHAMYGLTEHEPVMRVITDSLRHYCLQHGTRAEMRRFAAYDRTTKTVYVSRYDGKMWKLSGDSAETVTSSEDEVFFIDDDGGIPVEPEIGKHDVLIQTLIGGINFATGLGGITPNQQRMALIVWMFSLAFPDLFTNKPLLILEGAQGGGKTTTIQLIQRALMGRRKGIIVSKSQEADFGVLLLRSPIALIDNLDTYIDWIPDKICAYTTGTPFTKRKLYFNDEEVEIKPHAFVAVASKNPVSFRRTDVADRSIVLRFDRRTGFTLYSRLEDQLDELRPKLLGEYLYYVNQIVAAIRDGAYDENGDRPEQFRMTDYAAFARVVGRVLGWTKEEILGMMAGLGNERDAFAAEDDPFVDLLHDWCAYIDNRGVRNAGREVTIHQLFAELKSFDEAKGKGVKLGHPRQLAQKLRESHVEREFNIQTYTKPPSTVHVYRIWRATDVALFALPEEIEKKTGEE